MKIAIIIFAIVNALFCWGIVHGADDEDEDDWEDDEKTESGLLTED